MSFVFAFVSVQSRLKIQLSKILASSGLEKPMNANKLANLGKRQTSGKLSLCLSPMLSLPLADAVIESIHASLMQYPG